MVAKVVQVEAGSLAYVDDVIEAGRGFREYERDGVLTLDPQADDWEAYTAEAWESLVREAFVLDREDYTETVREVTHTKVDLAAGTLTAVAWMLDE